MKCISVCDLPAGELDAADYFRTKYLSTVRNDLKQGNDIVLIFDKADHRHTAWRKSIVAGLAREYAPARANAISGGDQAAQDAALEYLAGASGVTGQYLPLHDDGDIA